MARSGPRIRLGPFLGIAGVSRAFVKDQDIDYADDLPDRLVSQHPNDVTETGMAQIEAALADAILQAVNDSSERRGRGENAARHVRDTYSWNGLASRFTHLYERVAAARQR